MAFVQNSHIRSLRPNYYEAINNCLLRSNIYVKRWNLLKKNHTLHLAFYLFCTSKASAPVRDPDSSHVRAGKFRYRIRLVPTWEPKFCL